MINSRYEEFIKIEKKIVVFYKRKKNCSFVKSEICILFCGRIIKIPNV
jgi:hypothetical protein